MIRILLVRHFSLVLILSILPGLFMPGAEHIPEWSIPFAIGLLVFLSFTTIDLSESAWKTSVSWRTLLLFVALRFVALPLAILMVGPIWLDHDLVLALTLLSAVPAGVTSASLTALLGGEVQVAVLATIITHALVPISLPAIFSLTGGAAVGVEPLPLLYSLLGLIGIPALADAVIRRFAPSARTIIRRESGWISIVLISLSVIAVLGTYRDTVFASVPLMPGFLLWLSLLFSLFYLGGWMLGGKGASRSARIATAVASGANNNALAISLSVLNFSPTVATIVVISDFVWIGALVPVKRVLRERRRLPHGETTK